jgi:hypothetical protein
MPPSGAGRPLRGLGLRADALLRLVRKSPCARARCAGRLARIGQPASPAGAGRVRRLMPHCTLRVPASA